MPKCIILTGNIGSGKSTLVKEYVKKGYIAIARDALRYNIGAGKYIFDLKLEHAIWETELDMLINFLELGVNIIIDEVGMSRLMRQRYFGVIDFWGKNHEVISIEMPKLSKKESVDRRMQDPHGTPDRKVWEGVWDKFNAQYEKPTKKEGFDKLVKL